MVDHVTNVEVWFSCMGGTLLLDIMLGVQRLTAGIMNLL